MKSTCHQGQGRSAGARTRGKGNPRITACGDVIYRRSTADRVERYALTQRERWDLRVSGWTHSFGARRGVNVWTENFASDASGALNLDHALDRNSPPLRYALRSGSNRLRERGHGARRIDGGDQTSVFAVPRCPTSLHAGY